MVMLMLRCGLRVEEVARLKLAALDLRRSQIFVYQGKGALSDDAYESLVQYLRVRPASRIKEVFLVDKGRCRGKAISVRGIQPINLFISQSPGQWPTQAQGIAALHRVDHGRHHLARPWC
jgi:integrase